MRSRGIETHSRPHKELAVSASLFLLVFQRQLDASQRGDGAKVSFDPGEWSRNACFLADYYSGLERFKEAGRCLLAAQVCLFLKLLVDLFVRFGV